MIKYMIVLNNEAQIIFSILRTTNIICLNLIKEHNVLYVSFSLFFKIPVLYNLGSIVTSSTSSHVYFIKIEKIINKGRRRREREKGGKRDML